MAEQSLPDGCTPVQVQRPPRFNILHLPTEGMVQHIDLVDIVSEVLAPFADLGHVLQETSKEGSTLHNTSCLLERLEAGAFQLAQHKFERLMPAEVVHRG